MSRAYRLGRRHEAAEETRRRIVEATFELHAEQGIAATTMRQIAGRAQVSIGAVYHHFPSYEDAILACGAHSEEIAPAPDPAIFDGALGTTDRAERLVAALFGWFERLPVLERVRCDQDRIPILREFVQAEVKGRLTLAREALKDTPDADERAATLAALLDISVYQGLRRGGTEHEPAVRAMCGVVTAWLGALPDPAPRNPHDIEQ
jgi:AcrR family transcriptional regulator